ncbi:MAG: hypothetical protein ACXVKA_00490 [Acidimicrobiia bacterium]
MVGSGQAGAPLRNALTWVAAGLGAIIGVALLIIGVSAFADASDTRARADEQRRERPALVAETRAEEREGDAPIGRAEKVTTAVSASVEAADSVGSKSQETTDLLSRAVRIANDGNLNGARDLYAGEGATSVRQLDDELARAQAAIAAARQAVADLHERAP